MLSKRKFFLLFKIAYMWWRIMTCLFHRVVKTRLLAIQSARIFKMLFYNIYIVYIITNTHLICFKTFFTATIFPNDGLTFLGFIEMFFYKMSC